MGEDTLGNGNGQFGRSRIHTDDSVEVKYYDRPENFLDKIAFSVTGDLGCEYGGTGTSIGAQGQTIINNVNCHHNTATSRKQWRNNTRCEYATSVIPGPTAGVPVGNTSFAPGPFLSSTPGFTCSPGTTGFCPDLRKDEPSLRMAIMVKF